MNDGMVVRVILGAYGLAATAFGIAMYTLQRCLG